MMVFAVFSNLLQCHGILSGNGIPMSLETNEIIG